MEAWLDVDERGCSGWDSTSVTLARRFALICQFFFFCYFLPFLFLVEIWWFDFSFSQNLAWIFTTDFTDTLHRFPFLFYTVFWKRIFKIKLRISIPPFPHSHAPDHPTRQPAIRLSTLPATLVHTNTWSHQHLVPPTLGLTSTWSHQHLVPPALGLTNALVPPTFGPPTLGPTNTL